MQIINNRQLTPEQRLLRLESIEAIKRLKYRYLRACDKKDPAAIKACTLLSSVEEGRQKLMFMGAQASLEIDDPGSQA